MLVHAAAVAICAASRAARARRAGTPCSPVPPVVPLALLVALAILAAFVLFAPTARAGPWGGSCVPAVAGPVLRLRAPVLRLATPAVVRWQAPAQPAPRRRPLPKPPMPKAAVPCECPEGSPCGGCPDGCDCARRAAEAPDELPTGVNRSRLGKTPRYTIGGAEVSREEAVRSIGQLADDSSKPRLTLFGSDARKPLRAALMADAGVAGAVLCQDYPGGHWAVSKHPALGDVSAYLQRPTGETLWRGAGGDPAAILKAVKQALGLQPPDAPAPAPSPVPSPVPAPAPSPLSNPGGAPLAVWVGMGLLALIVLAKK